VLLAAGRVRSATMVSVLAYSGLRPGEMLGLELRHVRDRRCSSSRPSPTDASRSRRPAARTARSTSSTCSAATCARGPRGGGGAGHAALRAQDGSPWRLDDWTNWRNRHFHEATRASGLGTPRPYDLRHSFASLLIREQRVSIVDLADMLGHAPTMTLDTYSHVMREHRGQPPVAAETWITTARRQASAAPAPAATPPA
jgi:integrase